MMIVPVVMANSSRPSRDPPTVAPITVPVFEDWVVLDVAAAVPAVVVLVLSGLMVECKLFEFSHLVKGLSCFQPNTQKCV
jgi:hypothetical protein